MPDELDQMLGTLESVWATAQRRRWWILVSTLVLWAAVWGGSWLIPPTYQSETTILLLQQNVPNQYVVPNVSANVQDRLQTISQQVLSRTRMEATIAKFHLYPESHGLAALIPAGDPVDRMRKDIEIEMVPAPGHPDEFTAFKMRYTANSPQLAQDVNAELTSPFVNENVEAQQQLSEDTTHFLENELADARTKMEEQEAKVAEFKAKHVGEMAGLSGGNAQQILAGLQAELQNSRQSLDSARQHKVNLETALQQNQISANRGNSGTSIGAAGDILDPSAAESKALDKEIMDLRVRLQDLQERYTDDYPDVVALKDKIVNKERQKRYAEEEAAAAAPGSRKKAGSAAKEDTQNGPASPAARIENEITATQLEIQVYQKREYDLESQISNYLAHLNKAPEVEQELTSISRGYEESKANYNSLLQKQMQSQLATSLEQRQKGEQFRILDAPSLPKKRMAPNHFKFSMGGMAFGFFLGIGLVTLLELTDIRVRDEKDLKSLVPAVMMVSIPRLSTPKEEGVHAMARWLDFGGVTIMFILLALGNVYAFYKR